MFEFELDQFDWLKSRKFEFKLAYLIVVVFGVKCGYRALDDHFKFIYVDLDVHLNWA